jgi:hypothetical protein
MYMTKPMGSDPAIRAVMILIFLLLVVGFGARSLKGHLGLTDNAAHLIMGGGALAATAWTIVLWRRGRFAEMGPLGSSDVISCLYVLIVVVAVGGLLQQFGFSDNVAYLVVIAGSLAFIVLSRRGYL